MIRSIVEIKPAILIRDTRVVIGANISPRKVERYDIELTCPSRRVLRRARQRSPGYTNPEISSSWQFIESRIDWPRADVLENSSREVTFAAAT